MPASRSRRLARASLSAWPGLAPVLVQKVLVVHPDPRSPLTTGRSAVTHLTHLLKTRLQLPLKMGQATPRRRHLRTPLGVIRSCHQKRSGDPANRLLPIAGEVGHRNVFSHALLENEILGCAHFLPLAASLLWTVWSMGKEQHGSTL